MSNRTSLVSIYILLFVFQSYTQDNIQFFQDGLNNTNTLRDIEILNNNNILVLVSHFCKDNSNCSSYVNYKLNNGMFELNNNLKQTPLANRNPLYRNNNKWVLLLQDLYNEFSRIPVAILDNEYELDTLLYFMPEKNVKFYTDGIIGDSNSNYIWGQIEYEINPGNPSVFILKTSSDFSRVIFFKTFGQGDDYNLPGELKFTSNDRLAILYEADFHSSTSSRDSTIITTFDTSGIILSKFQFLKGGGNKSSLDFGLNSYSQYLYEADEAGLRSEVNCYDFEKDSVIWRLLFPEDPFYSYDRQYYIYEYLKLQNEDNLLVGRTFDILESGGETSLIVSGLIVRTDSDGKFKWLKRFNLKNELDDKIHFNNTQLKRAIELPDSSLVIFGETSNSNFSDRTVQNILAIRLSKEGCFLDNSNDTIFIHQKANAKLNINVDSKWVYETLNQQTKQIQFKEFVINDRIKHHNEWAFEVISEDDPDTNYLLVKDSCFYFWDEQLNDYQLQYNFKKNTTNYQTRYYNTTTNTIDTFAIHIDSTTTFQNGSHDFTIQHLSSDIGFDGVPNNTIEVVTGVGSRGQGGLKLEFNSLNNNIQSTKLRCFNNYGFNYKFVEYACDSTWLNTNTQEESLGSISIFPNPANNFVTVFSERYHNNLQINIFDTNGSVIHRQTTTKNKTTIDVSNWIPGIYFIYIQDDSSMPKIYKQIIF